MPNASKIDDQPGVVVYHREGCCLCDDAVALLQSRGVEPELVDVDDQPELVAQFGTCVPVVLFDGKVRFRGRVNPVLLDRLLLRWHAPTVDD